jgi:hypothetical protein
VFFSPLPEKKKRERDCMSRRGFSNASEFLKSNGILLRIDKKNVSNKATFIFLFFFQIKLYLFVVNLVRQW